MRLSKWLANSRMKTRSWSPDTCRRHRSRRGAFQRPNKHRETLAGIERLPAIGRIQSIEDLGHALDLLAPLLCRETRLSSPLARAATYHEGEQTSISLPGAWHASMRSRVTSVIAVAMAVSTAGLIVDHRVGLRSDREGLCRTYVDFLVASNVCQRRDSRQLDRPRSGLDHHLGHNIGSDLVLLEAQTSQSAERRWRAAIWAMVSARGSRTLVMSNSCDNAGQLRPARLAKRARDRPERSTISVNRLRKVSTVSRLLMFLSTNVKSTRLSQL